MPAKASNPVGYGCVVLFALPFLAGGLWMTWRLASLLWLAAQASGWEEVPATVIQCELVESRADKSTTYRVEASYQYEYNDRPYTGERVGLSNESDNISSYHQELYDRLDAACTAKAPVSCYVDPSDPTNALLDRRLRPLSVLFHLPFVLGFTGVGAGLIGGMWWVRRLERRRNSLREAEPEKPWLWREDWAAGRVAGSFSKQLLFFAIFGLFWNVVSLPIAGLFLFGDQEAEWWVTPIVLIFPTIGLGLLGWLAYAALVSKKYGRSHFRMASVPGVIGGKLSGVILASDLIKPAGEVKLTLTCQRTKQSGKETTTYVAWQDERIVDHFLDPGEPGRIGVPVELVIPSDGTMSTDTEDRVAWILRASAALPGVDYQAEFEVPVFRTEDSQKGVTIESSPAGAFQREPSLEEVLPVEGVRTETLPGDGVRYTSPPAQKPLSLAFGSLFAIGLTVAAVALLWHGEWFAGFVCSVLGLVFDLVMIEMALGSSDLRIEGDRWECRNGWYGFRRRHVFQRSQIRSIDTKKSSVQQDNTGKPATKHLVARLPGGQRVVLVRSLSGPSAVRLLLADLRRRAGHDGD